MVGSFNADTDQNFIALPSLDASATILASTIWKSLTNPSMLAGSSTVEANAQRYVFTDSETYLQQFPSDFDAFISQNLTLRTVMPSIGVANSGKVRFVFGSFASSRTAPTHVSVGIWDGTAGAANCTAIPIELTFGGIFGFDISGGATVTSDPAVIPFGASDRLVIIVDVAADGVSSGETATINAVALAREKAGVGSYDLKNEPAGSFTIGGVICWTLAVQTYDSPTLAASAAMLANAALQLKTAATLPASSTVSAFAGPYALQATAVFAVSSELIADSSPPPVVYQGTAQLDVVGVLSSTATLLQQGTAVLAGVAAVSVEASHTPISAATLSSSGGLSATVQELLRASSILAGSTSLSSDAVQRWVAIAKLDANSDLSASAAQNLAGLAVLSVSADVVVSTLSVLSAAAVLPAAGDVAVNSSHTPQISATLSGDSEVSAEVAELEEDAADLPCDSAISAIAVQRWTISASLSGQCFASVSASLPGETGATLDAISDLVATVTQRLAASSLLPAVGAVAATATHDPAAEAVLPGSAVASAEASVLTAARASLDAAVDVAVVTVQRMLAASLLPIVGAADANLSSSTVVWQAAAALSGSTTMRCDARVNFTGHRIKSLNVSSASSTLSVTATVVRSPGSGVRSSTAGAEVS